MFEFNDEFEYKDLTVEELEELRWYLGQCWLNPSQCICADKGECKGLGNLIKNSLNAVNELIRIKKSMYQIECSGTTVGKVVSQNTSMYGLSEREVGRMLEGSYKIEP